MLRVLFVAWLVGGAAWGQQVWDQQADQLLDLISCRDSQHELLRENLATCFFNLRHSPPDQALTSLDSFFAWLKETEELLRKERTYGSNELGRWPSKFRSSLHHPYTDREAGRKWQGIVVSFRRQCETLAAARPGYPRSYYIFGGILHGRFGANSDLDFIFNDPDGNPASKQFIVRGFSSGYAFDEKSFGERQAKARAGELKVVMGGPVHALSGPKPWMQLNALLMDRLKGRGLKVLNTPEGWVVVRSGYPERHYEDPATDVERSQKL